MKYARPIEQRTAEVIDYLAALERNAADMPNSRQATDLAHDLMRIYRGEATTESLFEEYEQEATEWQRKHRITTWLYNLFHPEV